MTTTGRRIGVEMALIMDEKEIAQELICGISLLIAAGMKSDKLESAVALLVLDIREAERVRHERAATQKKGAAIAAAIEPPPELKG